ncbi:MAG: acetyl-CoA carboxylase, carboxyltransferase subunit beta [Oscillospiraceae bacterium]
MLEDLFKVVKFRAENDNKVDKKAKVQIPNDLLFKCPRCNNVMFMDDFLGGSKVCSECSYHARLTVQERLEITIDKETFIEYDANMTSKNPINFDGYEQKIRDLSDTTKLKDAVVTGECYIRNKHCVVAVMDSHFMMGSMGSVVGEKITRAFEAATEKSLPIIIFTASGGARMQEGIVSLMQMAKTSAAAARHSEKGLLYITVLTDPTTGGVTASFASLGDIIIAEPKVLIGFAGRRVIESTIKQHLPDDFQSAEFLLEHGFVDIIVDRKNMRRTLSRLVRLHTKEAVR